MKNEHMNTETNTGHWVRAGLQSLAFLAPIALYIMDFLRKRQEMLFTTATDTTQRVGMNTTIKQLSTAGRGWSYGLLKRGEGVAENVASQSGKFTTTCLTSGQVTHVLAERGGQVTRDLTQRGGQVTHVLAERGGQVTRDITERGGQVTHVLAERGDQLLQPFRKRSGTFWTIFGFSIGMVAAAVITFVLLRKRLGNQMADEEGHIELPQDQNLNGASNRGQGQPGKPSGEILHLEKKEAPWRHCRLLA